MKLRNLLFPVLIFLFSPAFGQTAEYIEVNPLGGNAQNFPQFGDSKSAFSDIDGDGDLDLLICGNLIGIGQQTKLYKNIGGGKFLLVQNTSFVSPLGPNIDFGDIDADGDEDVLITGYNVSPKIYKNDGFGSFTLSNVSDGLTVWGFGAFIDVNGDAFMDIVMIGNSSAVFFNLNGNFTYLTNLTLGSSCKVTDLNNDGKSDIFILGSNYPVWINDGTGDFVGVSTVFENASIYDIEFIDLNNDQIDDIITLGSPQPKCYLSNGNLSFAEATSSNLPLTNGKLYCYDMDFDGDKDVLICGHVNGTSTNFAYQNNGATVLQSITPPPFVAGQGAVSIADIDNDGDEDVLVSCMQMINNGTGDFITKLYKNLQFNQLSVNTFSSPSNPDDCNGYVMIAASGIPDFTFELSNGITVVSSESSYIDSLCPGIYSVFATSGSNDTISSTFIIPSDSNYIFINPFDDLNSVDSIGITLEDCTIDYNTIDTIYIDSYQFNGIDSVTVNWAVIDTNGTHIIPSVFVLNTGFGNYLLQLSLYCTQKSTGNYFVVTEGISYTNSGNISLLEVAENNLNSVAIFPNPTRNDVMIQLDKPNAQLVIRDLQGKIVRPAQVLSGQNQSISLNEFENGIYLFEFTSENGRSIKRVVKN